MPRASVPVSRLREDFELYARNLLLIQTKAGTLEPMVLNPPQRRLHDAVQRLLNAGRPVRVIILKSRQVGISTYVQGFSFWRAHMNDHLTSITLAHKDESATKLFEMQRTFYDSMPAEGPLAVEKRLHNRKLIAFKGTRSSTRVVSVAKGSGRGFTCQILHGSEIAFYEDAPATMTAIKQAVPKLPNTAVFLESTPNGWGGEFHDAWRSAKRGKSDYIPVFIAWFDDPTCSMPATITEADLGVHEDDEYGNERLLRDTHKLTLDQLQWRRNTIANECSGDIERFMQEYPSDDESCFLTSGRPVFRKAGLDYQLQHTVPVIDPSSLPNPAEIETDHEGQAEDGAVPLIYVPERRVAVVHQSRGRLRIYEKPQNRVMYVVGAEPSEGDPGSDPSPIVVLNRMKLSVAAVMYTRMPPDLLARQAVMVARIYNEAMLIWEANNHGLAFGQTVQELEYGNVYLRRASEDSVAMKASDKMGYWSATKSKQNAVHTLRAYVRDAPTKNYPPITDPWLCHELPAWIFDGELALVPDDVRGYLGERHHGDGTYGLAMCLMAHRGSMDSPLEPIPLEELRAVRGAILSEYGPGHRVTPEQLLGISESVSCEDLENFDEMEEGLARAERAHGIGRMR